MTIPFRRRVALLLAPAFALIAASPPATPRELLTQASFVDRDRATALGRIDAASTAASAALRASPADGEAAIVRAIATGYRAKLTGNRTQAIAARRMFEGLIARDPRNAEAQLALGAWHVGAVYQLGALMGRAALGAQKAVGLAALDRAVALGRNRAMFPGLAALMRLEIDPADPRGRALAEAAAGAATPTALDRIFQRACGAVLVQVHAGNRAQVKALAARLLPLGWAERG